jgi:hypothetical protein
MKTANCSARPLVQNLKPFKGNNTFGEIIGEVYAVFSYGHHWPLFVNVNGQWYENGDRYSVTTSKHRSQLHPLTTTEIRSVYDLKDMIVQFENAA